MGYRISFAAMCAATVLATSAALAQQSAPQRGDANCAPNPWVTSGFCERINAFNRYYCEWPCGTPPPLVEPEVETGPFSSFDNFSGRRDRGDDDFDLDLDILDMDDAAPN